MRPRPVAFSVNSIGQSNGSPRGPKPGLRISVTPGAYYFAVTRSSWCIAYEATTFRSSPSRMRGGGQGTGERADRRFSVARKAKPMTEQRRSFTAARRRALARLGKGLDVGWTPPHSREALHDRVACRTTTVPKVHDRNFRTRSEDV